LILHRKGHFQQGISGGALLRKLALVLILGIGAVGFTPSWAQPQAPVSTEVPCGAVAQLRLSEPGVFELCGLPGTLLFRLSKAALTTSDWHRYFSVFTAAAETMGNTVPPLLGRYRLKNSAVEFVPRFPLQPGLTYQARVDLASLYSRFGQDGPPVNILEHQFRVPLGKVERSTRVEQIFPGSDVVPENLLRIYVYFSAPMSLGQSHRYVRLIGEDGAEVPNAFLLLEPELWGPERRRLTLLFDPGRIKRGLRTHEELGTALRQGERYRLVIDSAWPDGEGNPLLAGTEKPILVAQPDRRSPDPSDWQLQEPAAGSRQPLILRFGEPLDHALVQRLLVVRDSKGKIVQGEVRIDQNETQWSFLPAVEWPAGSFVLEAGNWLEDLAGNNLSGLFDARIQDRASEADPNLQSRQRLPFSVAAP
jgi:hypothetical protein